MQILYFIESTEDNLMVVTSREHTEQERMRYLFCIKLVDGLNTRI